MLNPNSELCNEGGVQLGLLTQYTSQFRQVEICVNRTWRTICAEGWTANNTRVVCRQLGLSNPQGKPLVSSNLHDYKQSGDS